MDRHYQLAFSTKPARSVNTFLGLVPGKYFSGTKKALDMSAYKRRPPGSFTARTAPIVMPINTATLAPERSLRYSYEGLAPYLEAGCVHTQVSAGKAATIQPTGPGELFTVQVDLGRQ